MFRSTYVGEETSEGSSTPAPTAIPRVSCVFPAPSCPSRAMHVSPADGAKPAKQLAEGGGVASRDGEGEGHVSPLNSSTRSLAGIKIASSAPLEFESRSMFSSSCVK